MTRPGGFGQQKRNIFKISVRRSISWNKPENKYIKEFRGKTQINAELDENSTRPLPYPPVSPTLQFTNPYPTIY